MFRLGDIYLMYAEAVLRGEVGSLATAVDYVNMLRQRANAATVSSIDLDFILAERGRELYWECHRRTDLIRFGQFSDGTYVWPLKGGVKEGAPVQSFYDIFPIPSSDLGVNPSLQQNDGYN